MKVLLCALAREILLAHAKALLGAANLLRSEKEHPMEMLCRGCHVRDVVQDTMMALVKRDVIDSEQAVDFLRELEEGGDHDHQHAEEA